MKKKKKKKPPKTTITTYTIPQEKRKTGGKPAGRKKVIEVCAENRTNFFAFFAFLGRHYIMNNF